ncbi:hypothetical protein EBU95_13455 [bacterium]|nr:hypothetical protein [bacterium]
MKNIVANIDFEKAIKNKDYVKIMNKASQRFRNQLDADIINSCQLTALWKALQAFDSSKNVKFTTFLYKGVFIECMKEIKIYIPYLDMKEKHHQFQAVKQEAYLL